jgi:hypothetical protein
MSKLLTTLFITNITTLIVSITACFIAYDAKKSAMNADWNTQGIEELINKVAEDAKWAHEQASIASATAFRIEEDVKLIKLHGR